MSDRMKDSTLLVIFSGGEIPSKVICQVKREGEGRNDVQPPLKLSTIIR